MTAVSTDGSVPPSLAWARRGTVAFLEAAAPLGAATLSGPLLLPGWTRAHVVAHVAANAEALGRLAHWARTGIETPMYAYGSARDAEIEQGARLDVAQLVAWVRRSSDDLLRQLDELTPEQWGRAVVTAQGRTVPAAEIPWLRCREVWIHAVDLDAGVGFADLPEEVLEELVDDILRRRGAVPEVDGDLADRAAWLAGRPHALSDGSGHPVPDLPPWL